MALHAGVSLPVNNTMRNANVQYGVSNKLCSHLPGSVNWILSSFPKLLP